MHSELKCHVPVRDLRAVMATASLGEQHLNGLLDDAAAIHLEREHLHAALNDASHACLLLVRAMVQELLDHIVSKHVVHERRIWLSHVQDRAHLREGSCHLRMSGDIVEDIHDLHSPSAI